MVGTAQSKFRVFLVGTDFYREAGGIQYVNRELLRMLAEFAQKIPTEVEVFSLNDLRGMPGDNVRELRGSKPPRETAGALRLRSGQASSHTPRAANGQRTDVDLCPTVRWHAFDRARVSLVWNLQKRLLAVKPDVVLFTHVHLAGLARMVRATSPRTRIAVLGHGVEVWKKLRGQMAQGLRDADAIVTPSEFTREKMLELNELQAERVTVIAHGLSGDWESTFASEASARASGHTMLSVTRLIRADILKGVDAVLRAMPEILRRVPEARYVVAGEGGDRPRLEQLARELGVAGSVEFRGELTSGALARVYHDADVFVLPSQTEGFGIVFLEAMYAGLPIVAARAGGAQNVVEDGVTGILVPPNDEKQLVSAATALLLLPEERRRLGEAGRARVEETYLFAHFAERWHRWMAGVAPEPIYLARQAEAFCRGEGLGVRG